MKKIIQTTKAPAPIGPYNQAILQGNILYTSGQIALDAASGELVTESIEEECKMVMENLKAVLEAANMDFEQVIKATIYLTNMQDFEAVNTVYAGYFDASTAPARECIQVAALPKGVRVEISVVAAK